MVAVVELRVLQWGMFRRMKAAGRMVQGFATNFQFTAFGRLRNFVLQKAMQKTYSSNISHHAVKHAMDAVMQMH